MERRDVQKGLGTAPSFVFPQLHLSTRPAIVSHFPGHHCFIETTGFPARFDFFLVGALLFSSAQSGRHGKAISAVIRICGAFILLAAHQFFPTILLRHAVLLNNIIISISVLLYEALLPCQEHSIWRIVSISLGTHGARNADEKVLLSHNHDDLRAPVTTWLSEAKREHQDGPRVGEKTGAGQTYQVRVDN
jgi:hypothetical protein